jgi:glycosyltransferase involved in cell wall biosynthesis
MTIRLPVLVDGRIFTLQTKGGISQLWAYIIASPSWQRQIRTSLLVYPGHEQNVHLAESGLLARPDAVQIITSHIAPSDNSKWSGPEHDAARLDIIAAAHVAPKAVLNTYYGENIFPPCSRYIVTALDFAHEELPGLRDKPSTSGVLRQKERAFRQASHVSFISNASRQRFFVHYGWYPRQNTGVIYLGHDPFRPELDKARNLIIHVGTRGGYKNFSTVAAGLTKLMSQRSAVRILALGGEPADAAIGELMTRFPGRVRFDPAPSDREIDRAMATATVYVSASQYEGFGIPLLNAMRMGTVPVVSDIPVYREIAGRRGIFFAPTSAGSLASALDVALATTPGPCTVWRSWDDVARDYVKLMLQ